MDSVVVHHQVQLHLRVDPAYLFEKGQELLASVLGTARRLTWPVAILRALNNVHVPCRT